jgi:hypothetical protein
VLNAALTCACACESCLCSSCLAVGCWHEMLHQQQSPYAQRLAAATLTDTLTSPTCGVGMQERFEIRKFGIQFLLTKTPCPNYVIADVCKLVCR